MAVASSERLAVAPIDPRSPQGGSLIDAAIARMRPAVRGALPHFERIFALQSPFAENLAFVGAQVQVPEALADSGSAWLSVGGTGHSFDEALVSCLGEGIELLSQFEPSDQSYLEAPRPQVDDPFVAWARAHRPGEASAADVELDWLAASDMLSGESIAIPADLALRRNSATRYLEPAAPLSIGCAAGPSLEAAKLRAVLELIERDAAAMWWQAGRPAAALSKDDEASAAAGSMLASLRGGRDGRRTWLLDITTQFEVPVLAAVSADRDGFGMACGLAARCDRTEAAGAALREMMQVELAYAVIAAKLADGGEAALAPADRRHLTRARGVNTQACALVAPSNSPAHRGQAVSRIDPLADILDRLARASIRVAGLDLTRCDLGLPVWRAIAPGLQTSALSPRTPRLQSAFATHGGSEPFRCGIDLF